MKSTQSDDIWRSRAKIRTVGKVFCARRFFSNLREDVIAQFRAKPFRLNQKDAEKCANKIIRGVKKNYREACAAGFL